MSAAGAKSPAVGSAGGATTGGATTDGAADLCNLGAVEAVAHMSQGALTSERYAQALLARCQSAHALNAFISLRRRTRRSRPRAAHARIERRARAGDAAGPAHLRPRRPRAVRGRRALCTELLGD